MSELSMSRRSRLKWLKRIHVFLRDCRIARQSIKKDGPVQQAMIKYGFIERILDEVPEALKCYIMPELNRWAQMYYHPRW